MLEQQKVRLERYQSLIKQFIRNIGTINRELKCQVSMEKWAAEKGNKIPWKAPNFESVRAAEIVVYKELIKEFKDKIKILKGETNE